MGESLIFREMSDSVEDREAPTAAITLTEAAASKIAELVGDDPEGAEQALRVAVRGGGCSGFQYRFDLVETGDDEDLRVELNGATALVDPMSLGLLKGSVIDFVDELASAEFRIRNPNARSSCGCGVSFSI